MAKAKQAEKQEEFLFAVGTPSGEQILRVGIDGNIEYIKEGATIDEVSKAFWNSFEGMLPITVEDVMNYPNDADLGAYVRTRMTSKLLQNQ